MTLWEIPLGALHQKTPKLNETSKQIGCEGKSCPPGYQTVLSPKNGWKWMKNLKLHGKIWFIFGKIG